MPFDPNWSKVAFGLHCEGANNSTTFTDVRSHTCAALGNAKISTANYAALTGNTSSGLFDGASSVSIAGISTITGDFTFFAWAYPTSFGGWRSLVSFGNTGSGPTLYVSNASTGTLTFYSGAAILAHQTAVTLNAWHHIAIVRSAGVVALYLDGVKSSTTASFTTQIAPVSGYMVLGDSAVSGSEKFIGNIEEANLCLAARWSASFTAPTTQFSDYGPIISGTVRDSSGELCARTIDVYRRSDASLAGRVVSNASTGAFSLSSVDDTEHYAVCLPASGTENALIFDHLVPV